MFRAARGGTGPLWTAKTLTTIDNISNGRLIVGVGAGWHAGEMANHAPPFRQRRAILRERVLAIKAIFAQEVAEFHGEHVNFDAIHCLPRPVQPGGPPMLGGFDGPEAMKSMMEWADGWLPSSADRPDMFDKIAHVRQLVAETGRDPAHFPISVNSGWHTGEHDAALIERLDAAGVERLIINLPPRDLDSLLPLLDKWARLLQLH